MAQVSYGTITINDITDITDIYLQYCMVADNITIDNISENNWFILSSDTTVQNKHYYIFNNSDNQYHIVTATGSENPTSLGWYEDKPYPTWQSGYQIWIREARIKEGIDLPEYGTPYLDTAVNQINKDLVAYLDTQGLSIEALNSKIRFIWTNLISHSQGVASWTNPDYPAGTYAASGKYDNNLNKYTIDYENSNTYGYNSYLSHNSLNLRYDAINMTQLSTAALTFYRPTTINNQLVQGDRGLVVNANGIDILSVSNYKLSSDTAVDPTKIYYTLNDNAYTRVTTPSGNPQSNSYYEHDIDAQLNANGLTLKKGGIKAGTAEQSGFIYLSTENYGSNLTINNHQASDWREIIGTKFGVDADGNLYASDAYISGEIVITSGETANKLAAVDTDMQAINSQVKINNNQILIGNENSFHILINGDNTNPNYGLGFFLANDKVAYMNDNRLSIPYSVVLKGMEIGEEWVWELNQSTKNLTLKWKGQSTQE